MSDIVTRDTLMAMVKPEAPGVKPAYWVKDYMGERKLNETHNVMQVSLIAATADEPFPGATANLLKFLDDHREIEIPGAMADTDRRVIDISFARGQSTHSEDA